MPRKGSLGTDYLRPTKMKMTKKTVPKGEAQAAGTMTKTKGQRSDPRWPDAPTKPDKANKGARGTKLTIAENPRLSEGKVTGNNIGAKIKFRNQ